MIPTEEQIKADLWWCNWGGGIGFVAGLVLGILLGVTLRVG